MKQSCLAKSGYVLGRFECKFRGSKYLLCFGVAGCLESSEASPCQYA